MIDCFNFKIIFSMVVYTVLLIIELLHNKQKSGQIGYILFGVFIPYAKIKRYYPILEKQPWLTPIMQIRRCFMLLKSDVVKLTKREIKTNGNLDKSIASETNIFLKNIGL